MSKQEILKELQSISGKLTYAHGHLDVYRGYDDEPAICMLVQAIDDISEIDELMEYIHKEELQYWKDFVLKVMNDKDRNNALTVAVACALKYIVKDYEDCIK